MGISKEQLEKAVSKLSEEDKILRIREGKSMLRFVSFDRNPELAVGIFEGWLGHWTNFGFTSCAKTFWMEKKKCELCDILLKYSKLRLSPELRDKIYSMRSKPYFLTYASLYTKDDNNNEIWNPPKIYVVSKTAADIIMRKYLNIVDGDFYAPDDNPSYALIVEKKKVGGGKYPVITYDLSRKVYKIPDFKVPSIASLINENGSLEKIAMMVDDYLNSQVLKMESEVEPEEAEVEEILSSWEEA